MRECVTEPSVMWCNVHNVDDEINLNIPLLYLTQYFAITMLCEVVELWCVRYVSCVWCLCVWGG